MWNNTDELGPFILNLDETAVQSEPNNPGCIVCSRGTKRAHKFSVGKGIHNTLVDIIFADGSALVDDEGNELAFWLVAGARRDADYAGSNGSVNTAHHIGGTGSYIAMTVKGYMTDDCWESDEEFVPWLIRMIAERKK